MAHIAAINNAVGELTTRLAGKNPSDVRWARIRDAAVKTLRDHSNSRANQFAVIQSLDGLVEKFSIRNREDLAEALKKRLRELPADLPWLPDILSMLLVLSDNPVDRTDSSILNTLATSSSSPPDLTWDDILAADPLSDGEIWEDVERGYHSSGDDSFVDNAPSELTQASSIGPEDTAQVARSHLLEAKKDDVEGIKQTRGVWHEGFQPDAQNDISELAIIREACMMLHGLPTNLYALDGPTNSVSLARGIKLNGASQKSTSDLLSEFARDGTSLNYLRSWVKCLNRFAFVQSIQAAVQKLLMQLDARLSEIEMRYIPPSHSTVVSVTAAKTHLGQAFRPFTQFSSIIQSSLEENGDTPSFPLLDALYDAICMAQAYGDDEILALLSPAFFAGLQTYTLLITIWANSGSLNSRDKDAFLVEDAKMDCELGALWRERFQMRYYTNGSPYAPRCLQPLASEVFALGKSKYLLLLLDPNLALINENKLSSLPVFQLNDGIDPSNDPMPFSHSLDSSLRSWITTSISSCGPLVQTSLFRGQNLLRALNALPKVFLAENGSAFQDFAQGLLQNLSHSRADLRGDGFLLTALASESLGSSPDVDSEHISAKMAWSGTERIATSPLRTLEQLSLSYTFSWPVQNITGSQSPEVHAKILVLLLQMYQAKCNLNKVFLKIRQVLSTRQATLKICQRLVSLVETMQSHAISTAYAFHDQMIVKMRSAATVDVMIDVWASYEKDLQLNLLLGRSLKPLQDAVVNILELSEALSSSETPGAMTDMFSQYDSHLSFLVAGVRSVSRTTSSQWLEVFAEKLQWSLE